MIEVATDATSTTSAADLSKTSFCLHSRKHCNTQTCVDTCVGMVGLLTVAIVLDGPRLALTIIN